MQRIATALRRVYSSPISWVITPAVFLLIVLISLLFSNRSLIISVLTSSVDLSAKLGIVFSLLGTISSSNSTISASLLLLFAVCAAVQVTFLLFYIHRAQAGQSALGGGHVSGVAGLVASMLGIGCAACGSVALVGILSLFGAGGLVALLPLHGTEFLILGIVLIVISIRFMAKKICDPLICPID